MFNPFGKKDAAADKKQEEDKNEEGASPLPGDDKPKEKEGDKAKGKDKEEGKGGVVEMPEGDYLIHVYVEKVKDINMPANEDTIDPMVVVDCLGQNTYTSAKKDIGGMGEVNYSEHLFLEPRKVDKADAESAKIMIKLVDKGFLKDALIGQFEFDMSYVYLKKDHILLHKWLAFSNPNTEDYAKIQCYMKVSISVACEGDEQVQITDDTSAKEDTDVMMSPALNPKFYQIKLRCFQGQDLPEMDVGYIGKGSIDAYLKLDFKGKKYRTKVITQEKGGKPVDWNTEFWLPAQIPVV